MSISSLSRKQVVGVVALIIAARLAGALVLGTSRAGTLYGHGCEIAANILAIVCSVAAARRGREATRLFWLLFGGAFALALVADLGWTTCFYFNIRVAENAVFPSLFYRLYAVPVAIALFLSEDIATPRLETFLDGCIVVGLVGLCMYQVQLAELKPHDPNMGQLITISAVVNGILVLAAIARFVFSTRGVLRRLFGRLAIYLAIYSSISFATSYVDAYLPGIDERFDSIWIITYLAAAALAVRWHPSVAADQPGQPRISRRAALLCFNISMAIMVLGGAILGFRMVNTSPVVGLAAVGLVLFSYAVRCALMQDAQEEYVVALKESNTRYECVALATNDVIWDRKLGDKSVTWNGNVHSLFGYDPAKINLNYDWWLNHVHVEDREQILSTVRAALGGGKNAWSGEYRFRKADGSYAFVLDRSYVIRDAAGTPVRMIGTMQDLSVRKQAEMEIERARQAAEAAAQAKSDFLSNMSHEIRTPLNGVLGMLEIARQTKLSPEQNELLILAEESAGVLLAVVNDVLDFSKIEAGRMELETTEFDISDAVAEATRTILVRAHQKNLDLLYHLAADVPPRMMGDPVRLKQVLVNLLGNAVKFTEKGQILLQAEVETSGEGDVALKFSVADTGIGVPAEKQQAIFQAFSQADSSITRKFGGTGLGLAISSNIVRLMKGKMWMESEAGKGSTFFFNARFGLPVAVDAVMRPSPLSLPLAARALVVDPHSASRSFLRATLASWGVDVLAVSTAQQALHALNADHGEKSFTMLLCDSLLPEMDGFDLIEQVKRSPRPLPGILLMLTSRNYQSAVARCQELGIECHLIKPFKRSELLSAVEKLLWRSGDRESDPSSPAKIRGMRRLNILLAEDNLVNQKVAVRMLQSLGHSVEVVENGLQAVEKVKSGFIDVVLMDGHMPEMDGFAATRAIREWEGPPGVHIPIVAMTAMAMEGDREACLRAGMDAFIPKPITMQILKETIEQVMDASAHAGPFGKRGIEGRQNQLLPVEMQAADVTPTRD